MHPSDWNLVEEVRYAANAFRVAQVSVQSHGLSRHFSLQAEGPCTEKNQKRWRRTVREKSTSNEQDSKIVALSSTAGTIGSLVA